ncbi:MAG: hypothetical protein LBE92_17100 [Chryseobacterium sp.]|jgi:hypothetical protein|uniref:hypothetical protein n=1 Tax=Chryseobacterium sp. TaxID=1871047 RepID=UPI00281EFF91|nr:hypothetical protein [Chryseobacterium sp.]MDR2237843.1 hypothetical protein [Chryseobacterium sp.]
MTFLYTARGTYDKHYNEGGMSWDRYMEWSELKHLTELVSLDGMLNEILVEPDFDNADDWNYIHVIGHYQTGFFTSFDFVCKRLKKKEKFNLLAVMIEPDRECSKINPDGFEFIGYELLDQDFSISALTNCGSFFNETFLPEDLNNRGLIDGFEKAYDLQKRLLENHPDEYHADTNVIAVWRHKTIGR